MTHNGPGLLANEIVDFCSKLRVRHGITIDLQAVRDLGEALVIVHPAAPARVLPENDLLTAREREVARLVCTGLSNKGIAAALRISPATAKDHVHRILQKTGFPNRASLAGCYVNPSIVAEER